jgi:hypothetical protein
MRAIAVLLFALALGAAPAPAQSKIGAGMYKGTYTGGAGGGDFHLKVSADGKAEIGFTVAGEEVSSKIVSFKIDGASLTAVYEFDLQGNKLQSAIQGTLKGKTLEGSYKTTLPGADEAVDQGTWKTTVVE